VEQQDLKEWLQAGGEADRRKRGKVGVVARAFVGSVLGVFGGLVLLLGLAVTFGPGIREEGGSAVGPFIAVFGAIVTAVGLLVLFVRD